MNVDVNALFEEELAHRKFRFVRHSENEYLVNNRGRTYTINLGNIRRDAARDNDPEAVRRFAKEVLSELNWQPPAWPHAAKFLLFSAESSDQDFGATIRSDVSPEVSRVLTLTDDQRSQLTWVTDKDLETWGVSLETATSFAFANQNQLLDNVQLEVGEVQGSKLGMVPLDSPYKASVIFASAFKRLVVKDLGWPVLVVIPCRDFIYVLPEKSALTPQLGTVVAREFRASGYPITTELLLVSDNNIKALGKYPQ